MPILFKAYFIVWFCSVVKAVINSYFCSIYFTEFWWIIVSNSQWPFISETLDLLCFTHVQWNTEIYIRFITLYSQFMAEKRFCYKKNEINLMNIKKIYNITFLCAFCFDSRPISNAPMLKKKKRCQQPNFLIDQALEQISYFEYQLSCFQFRISKIGQHHYRKK